MILLSSQRYGGRHTHRATAMIHVVRLSSYYVYYDRRTMHKTL